MLVFQCMPCYLCTLSDYSHRFCGIVRLYGDSSFQYFKDFHICVIGIGGVGSWAVEALARSGIGQLTLIDHDDISESNINRQIHSLSSTIDSSKVETMAARIMQINPDCQVNIIDDFITQGNCQKYLQNGYDYVIDAIDSFRFKCEIIYYFKRNKFPVISTGGAGGLTDPTLIDSRRSVKNLECPTGRQGSITITLPVWLY